MVDRTMEVKLLKYESLFLKIATPEDIEFERQQLEAMHECRLQVFRKTNETRSGAPVTRIEWEIVE
jgi:hypothetical protein